MNKLSRLVATGLAALMASACAAAPALEPSAVVVLPRSANHAQTDLATGIAVEVSHWLSRSPGILVNMPSMPAALATTAIADVRDKLGVDHVIWIDIAGTDQQPRVRYEMLPTDDPSRVRQAGEITGDDMLGATQRIASEILRELTHRSAEPARWPRPDPARYSQFLRALGQAHSDASDEAKRVALYEQIASGLEEYPPAVTELGGAYLDLAGKLGGTSPFYDRAEATLRRAFQLDTLYPPARQKLASYYAKRGRSEESVQLLQRGLDTHPSFAGFHEQLGYILRYAGLMDASLQSYRRSQELDRSLENLVASQDQITKSLIYLGKYQEALTLHEGMESYLARLGAKPDEKEWFYRGVIHLYAGERDRALEAFRRGAALDSGSVWTTFGRGYTGIARGDRDQVANVLAGLERHIVVDGERHYRLVHFASFLGETDRALKHLETAIRGGFFNAPYIASDRLTSTMRKSSRFGAVLGQAQQRHAAFKSLTQSESTPLAIAHATIVDVTGGPALVDQVVLVERGRIVHVGPAARTTIPPGAEVLDAKGRFLIPGLWDMHAHTWTDRQTRENIFPLYVAHGVTGIRDMTGDCLSICADRDSTFWRPPTIAMVRLWQEDIAAGRLLGPSIVASSAQLDRGDNPWPGSEHIGSEEEARAAVRRAKQRGVDFIKVHDDKFERPIYFAAADEARKAGLRFAGHVPASVTQAEASDAGQRSFEHMRGMVEACSPVTDSLFARYDAVGASGLPPDSVVKLQRGLEIAWMSSVSAAWCAPLFTRLRRNVTWQVPTLAVLWPYAFLADSGTAQPLEYVPGDVRLKWERLMRERTPAEYRFNQEMFARRLELLRAMSLAGVGVLAGSDPTNEYVVPGFGLHHELRLLRQAGLTPLQVLQAATIGPARFLRRESETEGADQLVATLLRRTSRSLHSGDVMKSGRGRSRPVAPGTTTVGLSAGEKRMLAKARQILVLRDWP